MRRSRTRANRIGVLWCGAGAVSADADRAAQRGEVDRLVGERADRPPQQHGLPAALGERLLGAEAEQVLVERADEVAGGRAVVGGRRPRTTATGSPPSLPLTRSAARRELVGHARSR